MVKTLEPLTGQPLLQKMEGLSHLSKKEKAKACGYYSNGRTNIANFMDALLRAQGTDLDGKGGARRGREASYRATVQGNGTILVGAAYTKMMGLLPGDTFEIKLGHKHIHLVKLEEQKVED